MSIFETPISRLTLDLQCAARPGGSKQRPVGHVRVLASDLDEVLSERAALLDIMKECSSGAGFQYMTFEVRNRINEILIKAEDRS